MASYLKDVQKTDAGYKYDNVNKFNGLSSKYVTGYLGTCDYNQRVKNYKLTKKQ